MIGTIFGLFICLVSPRCVVLAPVDGSPPRNHLFRFHRFRSNVTIASHITFDIRAPPSYKIHHSFFHHILSLFLSLSLSIVYMYVYTRPSEIHFEKSIYIYIIYIYMYSPFLFSLPPLLCLSLSISFLCLFLYISLSIYMSLSPYYILYCLTIRIGLKVFSV